MTATSGMLPKRDFITRPLELFPEPKGKFAVLGVVAQTSMELLDPATSGLILIWATAPLSETFVTLCGLTGYCIPVSFDYENAPRINYWRAMAGFHGRRIFNGPFIPV